MRGIPSSVLVLFFVIVIILEVVAFIGIRLLSSNTNMKFRNIISTLFILSSVVATGLLLYSYGNPEVIRQSRSYNFFYFVISLSFLNLIPKSIFALATAFSFLVRLLSNKRRQLIIVNGSFLLSLGTFLVILWGITVDRYNIRLEEQDLYFSDLPEQMEGFKIVQISDLHLGSFEKNTATVDKASQIIEKLNPDLLLFTGDVVNNFGDEINGFEPSLRKMKAKYGNYAIQGNHDYGDYYEWPDSVSKEKNLEAIENGVRNSGFVLLLNQWERVAVKDTAFAIIGVENWGHKPFPQYANLDQATQGIPSGMFRILMSHDPAHWATVIAPETDIPLTLSGHTHGGQFGIRIAGIEFSPMYIISKIWGGLYRWGNKYLYINRGLGTVGFWGRVEMRPEITLLTLHRTKNH